MNNVIVYDIIITT